MLPSAAVATPPVAGQDAMAHVSQNLFEHMASNSKGMPAGAGPNQVGENLMQRLNGFIDRSQHFSERASSTSPTNQRYTNSGPEMTRVDKSGTVEPGKTSEAQVDQLMSALSRVFDYSIETQMVVRGATQISGSANTLMKGQ
ncbi:hypothetical protein NAV39_15135 [Pseudomonas zhaodongensis]|nr:hypothetical protein [Stutzerimonas zhaodongensis]MCQ2028423.1 hypothetical protein [Stutzerimonas zhaodongensis]MCQ4317383.1 hypothetical protein [Stutzerimonas zhaodongensis]